MANPANNELKAPPGKETTKVSRQLIATRYIGPIPPAEELLKYEKACPAAADRIIAMAENQAKHRQGLEAKVIGSNVQNEKEGMRLAFALTIIIMLVGTYLIMNNKQVIGFIALFVPGLFQAGNYIDNKYQEHK